MDKDQARALLELIADLYRVVNEPDPVSNGQAPDPVKTTAPAGKTPR